MMRKREPTVEWSPEEDEVIISLYPKAEWEEILKALGGRRTIQTVRHRIDNRRSRGDQRFLALHRHIGTKPGSIPHNHVPVGYEFTSSDGIVRVKVKEGPNGFRRKHHVVWEKHYGPIPQGSVIRFRDGNRQNISIENLYLQDRRDLLVKENSLQARYPKEIQDLCHAVSALQRSINRKEKENGNE